MSASDSKLTRRRGRNVRGVPKRPCFGGKGQESGQERPLLIAIMGCEVNGPGEARGADAGIAFGKGKGAIFCKGEIVKTVDEGEAVEELLKIIKMGDKQ